jgi:hypothetical protein
MPMKVYYIHNFCHTHPDFDATMSATDETKKNLSNEWSFIADYIQGQDDDSSGIFAEDTMLCFSKHGTLALTFHASFNSGIVCSKCFQFMKPGSFALHCDKCNREPAPSAEAIKEWTDTDKKWANLRRQSPKEFAQKTTVKLARRDGLSAYVVHPRFYLGKTSSTMKLKALCITNGCTHVCAFNALHRHFKSAHMNAAYSLQTLDVVAAPTSNTVDDISENEVVSNADKASDEEDTGSKEGESAEGNVGVTEDDGGGKDDGKTDDQEEATGEVVEKDNAVDVGGGEESPAVDTQDLDCEPFQADDGPSDDDTAMGQGENKDSPAAAGKKKDTAGDGPSDGDTTMGQGENKDGLAAAGKKKVMPVAAGKNKQVKKPNYQAHVRKSARVSRAPARY